MDCVRRYLPQLVIVCIWLTGLFCPLHLTAQCEALIRVPGGGGLWIARADGSIIRRLTNEDVKLAAWSPDGKYVACSFGTYETGMKRIAETGLITRDGRLLSRRKDEDDLIAVFQSGLGWARPGVLWLRDSGHASSVVTFWRIPPTLDLKRSSAVGQAFGDACALSSDSGRIACIEAGSVALVDTRKKNAALSPEVIYPSFSRTPQNERESVEVSPGQVVRSHTDPAFQIRISREAPNPALQGMIGLNVTLPDGTEQGVYLQPEGGVLGVSLEDANWEFVLNPVRSQRASSRITIYRDDSKRELSGVAWNPDGSRILSWESTRHGSGPLVMTRIGNRWSPQQFPVSLPPAPITAVRFALQGTAAIVETPSEVYRCALGTHVICQPVAARMPTQLNVRPEGKVYSASVLDWRCGSSPNN